MNRLAFLVLLSIPFLLLPIPALAQSAPVLFFSDLDWGPKTGWEGSSTKGAAVSIWGKNFGSTRGSSYVTVNGVQLNSDSNYAEWDAIGPARGLERITFWIPSTASDGIGTISVTVNSMASNTIPFTVTAGTIYFISISDGSNSNNGLYSTSQGGSNGPFRDIWKFNPCGATDPIHTQGSCNPSQDGQYIVYVRSGTYTTQDPAGDPATLVAIRGPYGGPNKRKALVGYPGETPVLNTAGADHGGIWIADYDPYGFIDYVTYSKLYFTGGTQAVGVFGSYTRVVGNTFKDYLANEWTGVVMVEDSKYTNVFGNMFDHNGYDSYKHNIYIKTQAAITGDLSTLNTTVGWNEFQNAVASDTHGGVVFVSRASDVPSYYTLNTFIHDNYFHDGNVDFLYLGDNVALGDIFVYNNIFKGGTSSNGGFSIAWGTSNVYFYNNVFYKTGPSNQPMFWQTGSSHSYFKNNIWIPSSGQSYLNLETYQGATFSSDHDIFYGGGTPPSGAVNYLTSNPLFVNEASYDFHLQSTSPAKDAGISSVSSTVTRDYDGNTRPQGSGYDIGAYEYASGQAYDTQPPTIQITYPTSNPIYSTGSSPISISGTASDNTSVSSVTWSNNRGGSGTASGTTSWSATGIALQSGDNIITVTAYDPSGNTGTDTLTVTYTAPDTSPPGRSGGSPSGTLPAGTTSTTISLTTNESATCRYSTNSGISYPSMTNTFSTTGGTTHSTLVTGLQNGTSYNYYVKCNDTAGNYNLDDYTISFSVASSGGACIHESDNNPCDGCVNMGELTAYIFRWQVNNLDVTLRKLMEAIGFWKAGTGCTVPTCSEGQITSTCTCGGSVYSSGYCCSGVWQSSSCGVTPNCPTGQITYSCICEGATRTSGYCCIGSDYETLGPCCPNGAITSSCYCEGNLRSSDYCYNNQWCSTLNCS